MSFLCPRSRIKSNSSCKTTKKWRDLVKLVVALSPQSIVFDTFFHPESSSYSITSSVALDDIWLPPRNAQSRLIGSQRSATTSTGETEPKEGQPVVDTLKQINKALSLPNGTTKGSTPSKVRTENIASGEETQDETISKVYNQLKPTGRSEPILRIGKKTPSAQKAEILTTRLTQSSSLQNLSTPSTTVQTSMNEAVRQLPSPHPPKPSATQETVSEADTKSDMTTPPRSSSLPAANQLNMGGQVTEALVTPARVSSPSGAHLVDTGVQATKASPTLSRSSSPPVAYEANAGTQNSEVLHSPARTPSPPVMARANEGLPPLSRSPSLPVAQEATAGAQAKRGMPTPPPMPPPLVAHEGNAGVQGSGVLPTALRSSSPLTQRWNARANEMLEPSRPSSPSLSQLQSGREGLRRVDTANGSHSARGKSGKKLKALKVSGPVLGYLTALAKEENASEVNKALDSGKIEFVDESDSPSVESTF